MSNTAQDLGFGASESAFILEDWFALARRDQREPEDANWRTWLVLGGRGSGKTRTGAQWVLDQVRLGARRVAIIAPTLHDAREVMLGGDSGLLNIGWKHARPRYEPTRRRLVFPNGSEGWLFSAHEPDSLRGPQFDCAWGDEFCAWPDPEAVLSNLRMGLRLGRRPRLCLSSTPRPLRLLDRLIAEPTTHLVRSRTRDNIDNLANGFVDAMEERYGNSALGRQELNGEIVRDHPGAIFSRADIDAHRVMEAPVLDRILVALDPPATSGKSSDACGIIVVGSCGQGRESKGYVLHDGSLPRARPEVWAAKAVALFEQFGAEAILAESNQGGEMIETVIAQIDPDVPVLRRHAKRSKRARAVPVGLLYARGRVHHAARMDVLEDELCGFGGPHQSGSPDRMDALVWGLTEVLLGPASPRLSFF